MPTNGGRASPRMYRAGWSSSARPAKRIEAEGCSRRSRCSESTPVQRAGLSSSSGEADGAGQPEVLCGHRRAQQLETPAQTPSPIERPFSHPLVSAAAAGGRGSSQRSTDSSSGHHGLDNAQGYNEFCAVPTGPHGQPEGEYYVGLVLHSGARAGCRQPRTSSIGQGRGVSSTSQSHQVGHRIRAGQRRPAPRGHFGRAPALAAVAGLMVSCAWECRRPVSGGGFR